MPQPVSSNPAITTKSGMLACRSTLTLMRHSIGFDKPAQTRSSPLLDDILLRLGELVVTLLRADRVAHGERHQRVVEGVALSHVAREHGGVGRARGRACVRTGARNSRALPANGDCYRRA